MRIYLLLILSLVTACSQEFKQFIASDVQQQEIDVSGVQVTYLGTSSFLVTTLTSSVLIDGYISRESHYLVKSIEPNLAQITNTLNKIGVATLKRPAALPHNSKLNNLRRLDAVIPLHGHYDHAMDVGVVAGLTGATVYGDDSIHQIVEKSKARFEWLPELLSDNQFVRINITDDVTKEISVGDITITLFETPHSTNILSKTIEFFGDDQAWKFPASVTNMKQGISMAAHVEINGKAFLIFPTAGHFEGRVSELELTAETVFLGFGGLGWQNQEVIQSYVNDTVLASKAERVFPIHWDDHQMHLDQNLTVPFYEALDRALLSVRKIEHVNVRPISSMRAFNPFD